MRLLLYARLMRHLSWSRSQIDRFLVNAPNKYKVYSIPKKNHGQRVIAHPSKALKRFQRSLIQILKSNFKIHPRATAYKKGIGIKHNAAMHLKNPYILKVDFANFFNSITPEMFFHTCEFNGYKLSHAEKRLLSQALFWNKSKTYNGKLVLSVGAPSSPLISNVIMYLFDDAFHNLCLSREIEYSRYADDITFSTKKKNNLFSLPGEVRAFLFKSYSNNITINERKTVFTSKAHNRHVTGITLTNNNTLSIGRNRKKLLSVLIHKYKLHILEPEMITYLQGLLSFAIYIEPDFKNRMANKYSIEIINEILKVRTING